MTRPPFWGYLLVLIATVFWSGLGVIGKELYALGLGPLSTITLRVLCALGLLLAGLGLFRRELLRVRARELPVLALYGLVAVALNFSCYFYALRYTTVATAIVLVYTHPALVAILGRLILREPLDRGKVIALGLTLVGVFFVAQGYAPANLRLSWKGVLLALTTAWAITFYNLMGKRLTKRGIESWTVTFYGFLFGGLFLVIWWSWQGPPTLSYPLAAWGLILILALFPSILAYGLYLKALKRLEAGRAAIVATLEPVLASLLAFLVLGERIEPLQALGGLLVLGGVVILQAGRAFR
ncbi:MAG: DMT family transporter [Candidatus Acetothermia bacterium]|nr:DMT family transporter [Candidatus Acetothermia bacterium]MDH7505899.1 EamA family transporter [Candidatus Acetothermia bacterium]